MICPTYHRVSWLALPKDGHELEKKKKCYIVWWAMIISLYDLLFSLVSREPESNSNLNEKGLLTLFWRWLKLVGLLMASVTRFLVWTDKSQSWNRINLINFTINAISLSSSIIAFLSQVYRAIHSTLHTFICHLLV